MRLKYDVIVCGVGAMGSASALALAKAGKTVLAIDRYQPPHAMGSSHGQSRLIRKAYFEHPQYVPLLQLSYQLWSELAEAVGEQLFFPSGIVFSGDDHHPVIHGCLRASSQFGLSFTELSQAALGRLCPALCLQPGQRAYFEKDAGYLLVEPAIRAMLKLGKKHGVDYLFNEEVVGWDLINTGVEVKTTNGRYTAERLVWSMGAWNPHFLPPSLQSLLKVQRVPLFWFDAPACFNAESGHPAFALCDERFFYGFPNIAGEGVKVSLHQGIETLPSADQLNQSLDLAAKSIVEGYLKLYFPQARFDFKQGVNCLYTMSPDEDFILGFLPASDRRVFLASPCSGHGFKFSPVIGSIVAHEVMEEKLSLDYSFLNLERFL